MPATAAEVLQEFELESATTRRLLERVPADQLNWKPHPKSRSVGQLAYHVATGPGLIDQWASQDAMEMPNVGDPTEPITSRQQILAAHDDSVQKVRAAVSALGRWTGLMSRRRAEPANTQLEPTRPGAVRSQVAAARGSIAHVRPTSNRMGLRGFSLSSAIECGHRHSRLARSLRV